jgi:hypothetical protein
MAVAGATVAPATFSPQPVKPRISPNKTAASEEAQQDTPSFA